MFNTSNSLTISVSTIAKGTVCFIGSLLALILDTTIGCHKNLCVVKCRCFIDLLTNHIKCVHFYTPKEMGEINLLCRSRIRFFPFLQSFASHLHSGVDSLTVSTNSILINFSRSSFALIFSIIASACGQVSVEYRSISNMRSTNPLRDLLASEKSPINDRSIIDLIPYLVKRPYRPKNSWRFFWTFFGITFDFWFWVVHYPRVLD